MGTKIIETDNLNEKLQWTITRTKYDRNNLQNIIIYGTKHDNLA